LSGRVDPKEDGFRGIRNIEDLEVPLIDDAQPVSGGLVGIPVYNGDIPLTTGGMPHPYGHHVTAVYLVDRQAGNLVGDGDMVVSPQRKRLHGACFASKVFDAIQIGVNRIIGRNGRGGDSRPIHQEKGARTQ
jgi:hypothetical protein